VLERPVGDEQIYRRLLQRKLSQRLDEMSLIERRVGQDGVVDIQPDDPPAGPS
jgi:hypothetical protein